MLYRNGPARYEVGNYSYRHWFDGDGLVQRFEVSEGRLSHRARTEATAKQAREAALDRAALPTFGSLPPDAVGTASADLMSPANIIMLWHHQRLFALWGALSPHETAPDDLRTHGVHRFSPDTTAE